MKLKILPWIGENNCAACKNTSNPAIRRYIITAVFFFKVCCQIYMTAYQV